MRAPRRQSRRAGLPARCAGYPLFPRPVDGGAAGAAGTTTGRAAFLGAAGALANRAFGGLTPTEGGAATGFEALGAAGVVAVGAGAGFGSVFAADFGAAFGAAFEAAFGAAAAFGASAAFEADFGADFGVAFCFVSTVFFFAAILSGSLRTDFYWSANRTDTSFETPGSSIVTP